TNMKFFLTLLLFASTQAFSFEGKLEKEAFKLFISESTSELESMAIQEVVKALTAEGLDVSPYERNVIHKVSTMVGEALKKEMDKIVEEISSTGDIKVAVVEAIVKKLQEAASQMADGLHMSSEATEKFFQTLMKDIEALEQSSSFEERIEKMFENLFANVFKSVAYDLHQKRDLVDIFDKINDTLRRIVGHLHGKFHDLHDFLGKAIAAGRDKLHPHVENIKTLAKAFISHINQVSAKVAAEALDFFRPWASKLGDTWGLLVKDIHERLQKLNPTVAYDLHQKRDLVDIFDKINDTLRRIVGHLHGKFHDLHDFLGKAIAAGRDKLHPHVENIKTLAKAFISHINQVSAKVAAEALDFFRPWASKLGDTWGLLVKDIHERLQKLNPTVTPIQF
ncbi:uncharacterized protein LOC115221216, partial [Argonauta hians]